MRILLSILIMFASPPSVSVGDDIATFVGAIESLQSRIVDFQCEFEGRILYHDPQVVKDRKLRDDGLFDTYSGVYVHISQGDTLIDSMHRYEPLGKIVRDYKIVRPRSKQTEHYIRTNDSPIGRATVDNLGRVPLAAPGSFGRIFLVEEVKKFAADSRFTASISEGKIDGRNVKVISFVSKKSGRAAKRFWIDLNRGGHAVRSESYGADEALMGRVDVEVASFKLNNTDVWMPISGTGSGYAGIKDGKPHLSKNPTSTDTVYVVGGTLQFNLHPRPETFTIAYKPGTPISDGLRKLKYEFGQQSVADRVTKPEAEAMLREQIDKAERQRSELVAISPSRSFSWTAPLIWTFGAAALILSIVSTLQRRR